MPAPLSTRTRSGLAWPALLATVCLLILLLGGYTLMESRRVQQNLARELQGRAVALIGVLEASSRNAIATQTMLEEVVAQRLLDNARFVDFLVARSPRASELIQRLVTENKLAKVELLDREGQPITLPQVEISGPGPWGGGRGFGGPGRRGFGPGGGNEPTGESAPGQTPIPMMRGMMRPPEGGGPPGAESQRPPGMPFMWGQRWGGMRGDPAQLFPSLPKDAKIRRFWEGGGFGVAVPAQSFSGVIVIHADAGDLLSFRRETGLQPLIQDLGRQPGVVEVSLIDPDFTVLASSDLSALGRREESDLLREALASGTVQGRRRDCAGCEVYDVAKRFALERNRFGLIRVGLSTKSLDNVTRQAQQSIVWYSLGLLAVGVAGAGAIFWVQARHLAERRRLEAAVVHEQRLSAMGNLAAGVAHEIRNPLNAISIGLQRLRMEFAPGGPEAREEYAKFTRIMEAEVARLNTTVDQFLALARPLRLTLADAPLALVLQEIVTLLTPQAAAQGVKIEERFTLDEARVSLDRRQLTHAVMNIFLNALQAMPKGGTLAVHATILAGEQGTAGAPSVARISITDTGSGIAPDNLDRVFEPYFTTKEGGTGLGLALAHRIILEHQGEIRVENAPEGGARFVISLPIVGPLS